MLMESQCMGGGGQNGGAHHHPPPIGHQVYPFRDRKKSCAFARFSHHHPGPSSGIPHRRLRRSFSLYLSSFLLLFNTVPIATNVRILHHIQFIIAVLDANTVWNDDADSAELYDRMPDDGWLTELLSANCSAEAFVYSELLLSASSEQSSSSS
ncbi:unnamed protein product [Caenorhabditis brenneri]